MAIRIVSINIRHGGGKRIAPLADWLVGKSPSAVVLPEWRNNTAGQYIRERLAENGLQSFTVVNNRTNKFNGLLLAAIDLAETRTMTPPDSPGGELLMAKINPGIQLLGCYFPGQNAKIPFFNHCIKEAQGCSDLPFVMIGDINTGRNDLDIEGNGLPFFCTDRFSALNTEAGLTDLWRARHGTRQDWTWRSSVNGFRIDHVFGNKAFIDRFPTYRCTIDHTPRLSGLTDHSAVVLEAD
jgi:exodeoxyribonuclease III